MFSEIFLIGIEENVIRLFYLAKKCQLQHTNFVCPKMLKFKNDSIQRFLLYASGIYKLLETIFYNHLRNGDALYRWPL